MNRIQSCWGVAMIGLAGVAASVAMAQPSKNDHKPAGHTTQPGNATQPGHAGDHQLPPGMTEADMKACMDAATPGEEHAFLAKGAGTWKGKSKMWMGPDADPVPSECTTVIASKFDGRFTTCEMNGEIPGMGPYTGYGVFGYDNVAKKFQSTWIDNCSTAMMVGTGELSSDGKTLTWNFTYSCPITQKPTTMREIERITGKDTRTLEMYSIDPKSGKEFKMMEIELTRASGAAPTASSH